MLTDGSVDALDPKPTEIALLDATVAIGILQRLLHPLQSGAISGA
jgi:hypothetical protein